jgi:galacturonosyltransferase
MLSYKTKREMGVVGRQKVEKEFDRKLVVNTYLEEIEKITCQKVL